MPNAAMKPCSYPGCPELVYRGRCEQHAEAPRQEYQRDPERQRLYDRKWQARRRRQLAAYPWCADCLKDGIYTPATDVHHVIPHRGNVSVFNSSPLQSLCHPCHTKHTNAEGRGGKGEGAENVLTPALRSGRGLHREKNSGSGESR